MRRPARAGIAHLLHAGAGLVIGDDHVLHHAEDRLVQTQVDLLGLAGLIALTQGQHEGEGAVDAGDPVAQHGVAGLDRRTIGQACAVGQAGIGLGHPREAGTVLIGSRAEGGQMVEDDILLDLDQILELQTPLLQGVGAEVDDDDVGLARKLFEDLAALLAVEVQGQALTIAGDHLPPYRHIAPQRRDVAHVVALGLFDLDHFRAVFGQQRTRIGGGEERRRIEDADAAERAGRGGHGH